MRSAIGVLALLITTSLLVTACSRSKTSKGPSLGKRVVAIGQPAPKGGGRYKVGNPYQIGGKWYRPKEDPTYDRVGVASWYGELFHGRHTANGEIYDMAALTAAHPTLPMPVHVRVTNLENGRSLVVRVNDRGPYAHDRIIDMSARSAKLLGFKRQGTARVRVTYLKRAPINGDDRYERQVLASQPWNKYAQAKTARPRLAQKRGIRARETYADPTTVGSITPAPPDLPLRKPTGDLIYFVQVASFRRHDRARNTREQVRDLGPTAIFPAEVGGEFWYRVRIGPFNQRLAAERVRDQLRHNGNRSARLISE